MHACESLPLAARVADAAPAFEQTHFSESSSHLHEYWSASRQRLDQWARVFAEFNDAASTGDSKAQPGRLLGVIEEVLLSEVLSRVWAAAATTHDLCHATNIAGPVARSIHLGHQEARNRALVSILKLENHQARQARRLNVLRQKCERWTDMLLAYFPRHAEVERLSFDSDRCSDFATDLEQEGDHRGSVQALTMASIEAAAQQAMHAPAANAALNERIAAAIAGCLPSSALSQTSWPATRWQNRINDTTDATIGMIEELLALENSAATGGPSMGR